MSAISFPDPETLSQAINETGYAMLPGLLGVRGCAALAKLYDGEGGFRSRVVMARHGFGQGEYRYFAYPLPDIVEALRTAHYPPLAAIANDWNVNLGDARRYPADLETYLGECHARGQTRPTPLLLRYGPGDHNRLHQDLYGEEVFPLQVTILLSRPGEDFTGGEFVLTEQRPRQQSRVEVVPLSRGDGVVFPVRNRPVAGARGFYRATVRHGVSRLHSGGRTTLGMIFHNAR